MNNRSAPNIKETADICLILEGSYPYVAGGVSSWVQSLVQAQKDFTFHIIAIIPPRFKTDIKYPLPENIIGFDNIIVQSLPKGAKKIKQQKNLFLQLEAALYGLQSSGGGHEQLTDLVDLLKSFKGELGTHILLNSNDAWELVLRMYYRMYPKTSFLDYFWTWRGLISGLYSMLLCDIPQARLYHAISTGYAGLFMARACIETNRPGLLTEHGIYTNERRIEIALADWLYEIPNDKLEVNNLPKQLTDMWIDSFVSYSRACYQKADKIITLYAGNQQFQRLDDAPGEKLRIIPNGVDLQHFQNIASSEKTEHHVVALIGRVVPIKDVKTYIMAGKLVLDIIPSTQVWILGPTDEDPEYFNECQILIDKLGLNDRIEFKGRVNLKDYLGHIDVIALTSLSEAQPLVILEAGAVGIPCVATNVGACSEMINGMDSERPPLGEGGVITGLAAPEQTANAIIDLLKNKDKYAQYCRSIRSRVEQYYNKTDLDYQYKKLYLDYVHQ